MRRVCWLTLLLCAGAFGAGSGGVNAPDQRDKPYLVLISIDGFRWDYQDTYDTPALDAIAARGVRADALWPVFPTLTFPNHYSIATGLYPTNHGIIGNEFPNRDRSRYYTPSDRNEVEDGYWYGGQPIWVAAEKNGMVSAAHFFVGSEAPVDGVPLSYWHNFDASVPGLARVESVLEWLSMPAARRPHMIALYFEDVDVATHDFGPGSKESIAAIERVDRYLARLIGRIDDLPFGKDVYFIIVSDHGQGRYLDGETPFIIDTVTSLDDMIVVDHGASAFLYLREPDPERAETTRDAINAAWNHGRAFLRDDAPPEWQVWANSDFADVIVQAEPGYAVFSSENAGERSIGDHGWPRRSTDMHGIFLASGPRLPAGQRIGAVDNIDIYPLMMEILGLPITVPIDGDRQRLTDLLLQ